MFVRVCERERDSKQRGSDKRKGERVCVCVRERERECVCKRDSVYMCKREG